MPHESFEALEKDLKQRLERGTANCVPILQDDIAIDTKRAFMTIRSTDTDENNTSRIIIGGQYKRGILREQDKVRPVDYAIYIEARYSFVSRNVPNMVDVILDEF